MGDEKIDVTSPIATIRTGGNWYCHCPDHPVCQDLPRRLWRRFVGSEKVKKQVLDKRTKTMLYYDSYDDAAATAVNHQNALIIVAVVVVVVVVVVALSYALA
jgi:hypothetical protein